MNRFTLAELQAMPTINQSHTDNVKYEQNNIRVSLSRMTIGDGMPYNNQVTVEKCENGRWTTTDQYEAK